MATTGLPARQRPVRAADAAGTNARFALVVVLALVTSAKMVLEFTFSLTGRQSYRSPSRPASTYTGPTPT